MFFMGLLETLGTGGMSSAIGGAASLVDTGLNQLFAKRNARLELEQNKKLADYQYSKDLEMWNKGNLYNSPEEQMKRLKEAGLNPNLVYGNGTVGNTTGTLPKYQAPTADYSRMGSPVNLSGALDRLGVFLDLQAKKSGVDNLKADVDLKEQELVNKQLGATLTEIGIKQAGEDYYQSFRLNPTSRQAAEANLEKIRQDMGIAKKKWESDIGMREEIKKNYASNRQRNVVLNALAGRQSQIADEDIELKRLERAIKSYSAKMADKGVNPNSPSYWQGIQGILKELGIDITSEKPIEGAFKKIIDTAKSYDPILNWLMAK